MPSGGELFDHPLEYQQRRYHLQVVTRDGEVTGMLVRPGDPTGTWLRSKGMWRQIFFPYALPSFSWFVSKRSTGSRRRGGEPRS
jgi:hypothetical protein